MDNPPLDMAALQALYALLPTPPPPIPVAPVPGLRFSLAGHLRTELKRRTFPAVAPGGSSFGLTEYDIADLVIDFLRPCACYPNPADHEEACQQHGPTEEPKL